MDTVQIFFKHNQKLMIPLRKPRIPKQEFKKFPLLFDICKLILNNDFVTLRFSWNKQ